MSPQPRIRAVRIAMPTPSSEPVMVPPVRIWGDREQRGGKGSRGEPVRRSKNRVIRGSRSAARTGWPAAKAPLTGGPLAAPAGVRASGAPAAPRARRPITSRPLTPASARRPAREPTAPPSRRPRAGSGLSERRPRASSPIAPSNGGVRARRPAERAAKGESELRTGPLPNLQRGSHSDPDRVGLAQARRPPSRWRVLDVAGEVEAVVDGPAEARAERQAVAGVVVLGLDARPGRGDAADELVREVLA